MYDVHAHVHVHAVTMPPGLSDASHGSSTAQAHMHRRLLGGGDPTGARQRGWVAHAHAHECVGLGTASYYISSAQAGRGIDSPVAIAQARRGRPGKVGFRGSDSMGCFRLVKGLEQGSLTYSDSDAVQRAWG